MDEVSKKSKFNFYLIPTMFVLAVLPLITYLYQYYSGFEVLPYMSDNTYESDYYLYYKSIAVTVLLVIMAILIFVKLALEGARLKFCKAFLPLVGYMFFTVLSTVTSEHIEYSLKGLNGLFQTVWVLLGYCVIAYYAFLTINDMRDVRLLLISLTAGVFLMVLLGMSQALKFDFFATDVGKWLTLPSELFEHRDHVKFMFEPGRVYLSLYNPNYVGSYVSLLVPVFVMLIVVTKNKLLKVLYALISLGLLFCLFASQSRAGFVGVIMAGILLIVIFNKQLLKHWVICFSIVLSFVIVFVGMNIYLDGILVSRIKDAFSTKSTKEIKIESIETLDDEVRIRYCGNNLHVYFEASSEGTWLVPYDDDLQPIECTIGDEYGFTLTDPRFEGIKLKPVTLDAETGYIGFLVTMDDSFWNFYNDGKTYYYMQFRGKYMKLKPSRSIPFLDRNSEFASGRGFIWSHTIPLLGDYIIKGIGPDDYFFAYPNDDQVALHNYSQSDLYNVKPHNMFMQIWVETGLLSLLCVLAYYCMYFIPGVVLYIKRRSLDAKSILGIGILCGTFGYMVVGLINDSTVAVAPVFWALTGIGIAINLMVRREKAE